MAETGCALSLRPCLSSFHVLQTCNNLLPISTLSTVLIILNFQKEEKKINSAIVVTVACV